MQWIGHPLLSLSESVVSIAWLQCSTMSAQTPSAIGQCQLQALKNTCNHCNICQCQVHQSWLQHRNVHFFLKLTCQVHLRHCLRSPRLLCLCFLIAWPGLLPLLTARVSRHCTWCTPSVSQLQRTWWNICGLDLGVLGLESHYNSGFAICHSNHNNFSLAHHCMTHVLKMTGPVFNSRPFSLGSRIQNEIQVPGWFSRHSHTSNRGLAMARQSFC